MEKSSRLKSYMFGNVYKATVPSSRRFWERPLPSFLQSDPAGVDGQKKTNCRARHKPHAVVANGAALQRVPSSLRLLQKYCREADVPLFVVDDPRVWGGNTHKSLPEALRELRRTVKNRVISQALKQQGSSAFTRGRLVGQVETEAKWQAKDKSMRARNFFTGGTRRRKSEEPRDWSHLDAAALEKRLVQGNVIQKIKDGDGVSKREYTPAMVDVALQCLQDEEDKQREHQGDSTQDDSSKQASEEKSVAVATNNVHGAVNV
jgi:hypothetical protein